MKSIHGKIIWINENKVTEDYAYELLRIADGPLDESYCRKLEKQGVAECAYWECDWAIDGRMENIVEIGKIMTNSQKL